ncbi:hypothetical protein RN001_015171 [Aquatica leii]|uniref:THAP-type domain-containing protein n=1 Tax=Aquatica leii TaxID=1421715 RepID=A0AAN7PQF4_9COLE|nr:hypothetical protein RN001_015171 [Aquatica leii]
MVNCAAYNCNSHSARKALGVSFHRFPIDPAKRHVWIFNTNRNDWVPTKNDRLCSRHFEKRYMYKTNEKVRLLNNAVPTLFLPSPEQAQLQENLKGYCSEDDISNCDPLSASSANLVETSLVPLKIVNPTITNSPSTLKATVTLQKQDLDKVLCRAKRKSFKMSKTIKILRQSLRRSKQQIASLKNVIKSLKTRNICEEKFDNKYTLSILKHENIIM